MTFAQTVIKTLSTVLIQNFDVKLADENQKMPVPNYAKGLGSYPPRDNFRLYVSKK